MTFITCANNNLFGLSIKPKLASSITFLLFLFVSGCTSKQILKSENPKITFFDVGNGTCSLISCGNQKAILYDCGYSNSKYSKNQILKIILEEVRSKELSIVLSHGDTDHYNLVQSILENSKSEIIGYGGHKAEYGALQSFMPQSNELGIATKKLKSNCPQIKVKLVEGPQSTKTNVKSLMLLGEYRNFKFLFTGDATGKTEKNAIFKIGKSLENVNLLTASHHGASSEGSNNIGWIQYLKPQYIIFSAGNHRGYGHPRCLVKERYEEVAIPAKPHPLSCWDNKMRLSNGSYSRAIYNTYDSGSLTFDLTSERIEGFATGSDVSEKGHVKEPQRTEAISQLIKTKKFECIKKKCDEISTCEEAMYLFKVCGYSRLDGGRGTKGIPCEKICTE